jgi:4-hydroxy-tetrahydrodipicolinate reductase
MSPGKDNKTPTWIHGSSGRMGQEIQIAIRQDGDSGNLRLMGGNGRTFEGDPFLLGKKVTPELLAGALKKDHIGLVFDFTNAEASEQLIAALKIADLKEISVLVGSTGMTDAVINAWQQLAGKNRLRLLIAPNTSIGVLVSSRIAADAAAALGPKGFDIEIVETHHRAKIDAPSGTARYYASQILARLPGLKQVLTRSGKRGDNELGMHAIRGGGVFGEHEVRMISDHEEVRISHRAFSRALFGRGAVTLGQWLTKQKPGFYRLDDVNLSDL